MVITCACPGLVLSKVHCETYCCADISCLIFTLVDIAADIEGKVKKVRKMDEVEETCACTELKTSYRLVVEEACADIWYEAPESVFLVASYCVGYVPETIYVEEAEHSVHACDSVIAYACSEVRVKPFSYIEIECHSCSPVVVICEVRTSAEVYKPVVPKTVCEVWTVLAVIFLLCVCLRCCYHCNGC